MPSSCSSPTTQSKLCRPQSRKQALAKHLPRFTSKASGPQKAAIVRQSLLPFLETYMGRASSNISPDILERRSRTLYRWWTALMAQLRNRNTQTISGTDRPAYYDAVSLIMSRPEWRSAPSSFAPLSAKSLVPGSASSTSLASSSSAFSVAKSVQHNIEVLFTRTLYDTFSYVVEKMGMRSTPLGLVAFAGKVVAYAFYFCQGVAEMLIGLWNLDSASIRRVLPEFGLGRTTDLRHVSDTILTNFPETLYPLGFTTLAALIRQMKKPQKAPIGVPVDWHGPWLSRWKGRDSDLLPVFLKQYHILTCEFMPPDATLAARLCAPGYVPILAQMLSMVDAYVHRSMAATETTTTSTTFEDLLNNTTALALSVRNTSARTADNKLVVLLQDIISDIHCSHMCRDVYATSLVAMVRAAVQKTRLYDSDACFQLCDLIEELLPVLGRAGRQGNTDYIDWKFWLTVAQMMLNSENNMTELRVISFVYTSWDILVATEDRKRIVCLDWLLTVPIWERFFCHWCPMVRSYYMRLLCWRLGRLDYNATELDRCVLLASHMCGKLTIWVGISSKPCFCDCELAMRITQRWRMILSNLEENLHRLRLVFQRQAGDLLSCEMMSSPWPKALFWTE